MPEIHHGMGSDKMPLESSDTGEDSRARIVAPRDEARRLRILVVEDDASIQRLVRLYLEEAGFAVQLAASGPAGLDAFERERPDFVVLDLMLPGLDGWEVCQRIRQQANTPILMLTARGAERDRLLGFELGADDYLTKPFSPRELVSRVRAIARRAIPPSAALANKAPTLLTFPYLTIDVQSRRVEVHGVPVELRAREFELLLAFARVPDQVLTREDLLRRVWGYEFLGDSRTVDVHVGMLRKKIEADPAAPRFLKTVRRVGYRFDPSAAEEDAHALGTAEGDEDVPNLP